MPQSDTDWLNRFYCLYIHILDKRIAWTFTPLSQVFPKHFLCVSFIKLMNSSPIIIFLFPIIQKWAYDIGKIFKCCFIIIIRKIHTDVVYSYFIIYFFLFTKYIVHSLSHPELFVLICTKYLQIGWACWLEEIKN
jgi:hypothetical protein